MIEFSDVVFIKAFKFWKLKMLSQTIKRTFAKKGKNPTI